MATRATRVGKAPSHHGKRPPAGATRVRHPLEHAVAADRNSGSSPTSRKKLPPGPPRCIRLRLLERGAASENLARLRDASDAGILLPCCLRYERLRRSGKEQTSVLRKGNLALVTRRARVVVGDHLQGCKIPRLAPAWRIENIILGEDVMSRTVLMLAVTLEHQRCLPEVLLPTPLNIADDDVRSTPSKRAPAGYDSGKECGGRQ